MCTSTTTLACYYYIYCTGAFSAPHERERERERKQLDQDFIACMYVCMHVCMYACTSSYVCMHVCATMSTYRLLRLPIATLENPQTMTTPPMRNKPAPEMRALGVYFPKLWGLVGCEYHKDERMHQQKVSTAAQQESIHQDSRLSTNASCAAFHNTTLHCTAKRDR
jgi:hypothetical protein